MRSEIIPSAPPLGFYFKTYDSDMNNLLMDEYLDVLPIKQLEEARIMAQKNCKNNPHLTHFKDWIARITARLNNVDEM